jgi:hypothetical protein
MLVFSATWEAERGILCLKPVEANSSLDPITKKTKNQKPKNQTKPNKKNPSPKRASRVGQSVGPEVKPQYGKKHFFLQLCFTHFKKIG